jgi:hypothetical protein
MELGGLLVSLLVGMCCSCLVKSGASTARGCAAVIERGM